MKARIMFLLAALMISATVLGDEVSDALAKAAELYKAKKYAEAKAEIEKALASVTTLAREQIPAPEIKDRTYVNYEFNFRVTRPEKDWVSSILKTISPGPTYTLCSIARVRQDKPTGELALFYVQNLSQKFGVGYKPLAGADALAYLKKAGNEAGTSVKILSTLKNVSQSEFKVSGLDAVRTDYAGVANDKSMKCFTVHVLRDNLLFTGVFVGLAANEADASPAFKEILDSVDLSPVTPPAVGK